MKSIFYKQKNLRYEVAKNYKNFFYNYYFLNNNYKLNSNQKLFNFIKYKLKVVFNKKQIKIKNQCLLSNRRRAIYKEFGLSRIKLRELASWGHIPGIKKSSW